MALSFGGTDNNLASFENAKVVVLPVPYGKTVSYRKGTEKVPAAILEASDKMELFDEELDREPYRVGINTADLLGVEDLEPGDMINTVEKKVSDIFKHNKMPVILGGEHSVTIGAAAASKKRYKDLSILYFEISSLASAIVNDFSSFTFTFKDLISSTTFEISKQF